MAPNPESTTRVATVGSPSSNFQVTLDLTDKARDLPLVGSVLYLENPMGEGAELAIGTVTEVVTTNRWHEDPTFRGVVRTSGEIAGMSGDDGDVRQATIRLQAAWRRTDSTCPWASSGPSLRMSPATGTPVGVVTDDLIDALVSQTPDLHYMGHLAGTEGVRLPLSLPDYSSALGALHMGLFGTTGAGKTAASSFLLAGQMRHRDHGIVIVDPQGQWASEEGFVFSVQGFAAELGREVLVRRISSDLRLEKSAPLLVSLLTHTSLAKEFGLKSGETQDYMWGEVEKWVRKQDDWEAEESGPLLTRMLEYLRTDAAVSRIYSTKDNQDRFKGNIDAILDDPELLGDALDNFAPIHNLFQATNPSGTPRHSLWGALSAVFERDAARPAPLLILDMSSRALPGLDDQVDRAAERAYEILEKDTVKAAILRNLFATLKRASEDKFRAGQTLNTMIVLDEAWRYAAPPVNASSDEVAALSTDLAGYARDTRKFGIGWFFISQSPRSINSDIWAQMSVRLFGYGLGGADLEKMVEALDDRDSLRLYRGFAPPRSTGQYPFLLTGPISPLAVTNAPVALHVYTDFDAFRTDNTHWIAPVRQAMGEKVLTGGPKAPTATAASRPRPKPRPASGDVRKALLDSGAAARENRAATGMKDAAGFADPLAALDDEPPF